MIEEHVTINFLLKQKSDTNNNTSSINKTVPENDKILETEGKNSSPKKRNLSGTFQ